MNRYRLAVIAVLVGSLAACAPGGKPFDSGAWRNANTEQNDPVRLSMVDDLVRSKRLVGKTRPQVVELLGEPDGGKFQDWDMVYWVGPERGTYMAIDSEWLIIRLDESGRVVEVKNVRD